MAANRRLRRNELSHNHLQSHAPSYAPRHTGGVAATMPVSRLISRIGSWVRSAHE